jgi:dTDP-L-rhamnose 4-epimerase
MKILITGGAGFIGSKIINKIKNQHEILVLDNLLEQVHGNTPKFIEGIKYIVGDVRNKTDWEKCLSMNPEIIIHMASETGTGQSMDEIDRYVTTNIGGVSVMLDYLNNQSHNVKKIILTSSRAVYGDSENIEINECVSPLSIYGITKLVQEQLVQTGLKIPYTILRFQNVFGEGQSLLNPYTGIISIFSKKIQNNEVIELYDNGNPTRDFIHVDDVVDSILLCLENNISDYKTYNVGTGKKTSILEMTKKLQLLINTKTKIVKTKYHRKGDVMDAVANIEKIKKELNWNPKITVDEGLNKFIKWFKNE